MFATRSKMIRHARASRAIQVGRVVCVSSPSIGRRSAMSRNLKVGYKKDKEGRARARAPARQHAACCLSSRARRPELIQLYARARPSWLEMDVS